eukprot:RCo044881
MASPFSFGSKKPSARKVVIKPFKEAPKLPDSFESETWAKLKAAIVAVQMRQGVQYSEEELYNAVQSMCLHKFSANLYDNLRCACEEHIRSTIYSLVGASVDSEAFLELLASVWDRHCEQMHTVKLIFAYLDRTYVFATPSLRSIWNMGLDLFCKYFMECSEVRTKAVDGFLLTVQKERDGEKVQRSLLHKLVGMLLSLQVYKEIFEPTFLSKTREYYAKESLRLLYSLPLSEYLKHVDRRISEENDRVLHYIDSGTRRPLIGALEQLFLRDHVAPILERGFDAMLEENQVPDLARLYRLMTLVGAQEALRNNFKIYIRKTGLALVMDEEKDPVMLTELLKMKAKLDNIWENAFAKNEQFGYSLRDAFENFVNQRQNKPAELIAKYLDSKLRSGAKGESEDELEELIDKVMVLFRFVRSKDIFEAFYTKDLAKRLLFGRSASADAEKSIISKLKAECGTQLSFKLEGMFKDIELSRDIVAAFRQSRECRDPRMGDVELNVYVLTTGYWPNYPVCEVKLPKELSEHQEVFKSFYLSRYQGRRLLWQPNLAQCIVRGNFPLAGRRELSVSLFQALVLLLFNDADELSFAEIKEATGIEDSELQRTLQSLALGLVRVLKRRRPAAPAGQPCTSSASSSSLCSSGAAGTGASPAKPGAKGSAVGGGASGGGGGAEISPQDVFVYASDFTSQKARIKINQIQMKETTREQQDCTEKVFVDRQYQIDAAVVRLMKARKTLTHSALLQEVFAILKFPVTAVDLKKRIENLLERDFLRRDDENPAVYHYVA